MTLLELVRAYKEKQEDSYLEEIIFRFEMVIKKYSKHFIGEDKEDICQELRIAIVEAAQAIEYAENEGQCVNYFNNAIRYRYLEIVKQYLRDKESLVGELLEYESPIREAGYEDCEVFMDFLQSIKNLPSKKQIILKNVVLDGLSDHEAGKRNGVSRQYVHRIRKEYGRAIREVLDS